MDSNTVNAFKFRQSLLATYLTSQIKDDSKRTKIGFESNLFSTNNSIAIKNDGLFSYRISMCQEEDNLTNDFDQITIHSNAGYFKRVSDVVSCCNTIISVQRESTKKFRHKRKLRSETSWIDAESFSIDCNPRLKVITIVSTPNSRGLRLESMTTRYTFDQYNSNKEIFSKDLENHLAYIKSAETVAYEKYRTMRMELNKTISEIKDRHFGKTS